MEYKSKQVINISFFYSRISRLATLLIVAVASLFFVATPSHAFADDTYIQGYATVLNSTTGLSDLSDNQYAIPLTALGCGYSWPTASTGTCGGGLGGYDGIYPNTSNYMGNSWGAGAYSDLSSWNPVSTFTPDWWGFPDHNHFWLKIGIIDVTAISPSFVTSMHEPYIYIQYTKDYTTGLWSVGQSYVAPTGGVDPLAGTTHIASTTPADYQIVATSTTFYFGVSGEITPADLKSTSKVKLSYYSQSLAQAVVSPSVVTDTQEWNLATSGVFSFSTTTDFSKKPLGVYIMMATITHDLFSIFGFSFWEVDDTVYSSQFDVSSTSVHAYYTNYDAISAYAHGSSGSPADYGVNTPPDITTCDFNFFEASTSMSSAMQCLFIPNQTDLKKAGQDLYNNIFTLFPLGYLTRFITIIASTTPVEPPAMTYRFGSSSPAVLQAITSGDPISFNVFDHFDKITQIRADDGTNKTIWDIVDPYFTVVVSLAVLLSMISDLIGFEIPHETDEERIKKIDYGKMSDSEFKKRVKINDYSDESDAHFDSLKRNRLI